MSMLSKSRFNPKPGLMDFWTEFRKPNPYRWPILLTAALPVAGIIYWFSSEVYYTELERPTITYIESFEPDRTDEEIMATNEAEQEVKELREAERERIAQRKRDLYKALGSAAGMDVEAIEERAEAERAEAEAKRQAQLDALAGNGAAEDSTSETEGTAP